MLNWRCRLGLHCWEVVDTYGEWTRYCIEKGFKKKDIPVRIMFARGGIPIDDEFCSRCDKLSLEHFDANKELLERDDDKEYVLIKGKVVEK